ncbi:MAG: helix-turn-helix domain-containing protein [Kiritimatiellae bacterium]|nr:helix-turn-helix domain-containing protein [Kiritimatiellia bacterium]
MTATRKTKKNLRKRIPQVAILLESSHEISRGMIRETSQPPLSSVAVDMEQAAYAAAEMLDHLMRKTQRDRQCVLFKPQQVVTRDSTRRLQVNDRLVIRALEHIRINAGLNIRVSDVAEHVGVTPRWLEKRFAQTLGRSAMEEIQRARMATVRSLVADTNLAFKEIARRCGFTGANHLGVLFRAALGMTMSEYRQRRRS